MRSLRFLALVAVCGGVLMALEILSSRLLSPYFGNSVYVWGSIISVFLAALALGYSLGGHLADRFPSLLALGQTVLLAAACQAVLLLVGEPLAAGVGRLTGGTPAGTLLAVLALFGPATLLLGMVSPWAVRLAARDLDRLGTFAGRLFAVSTAGSLVGTLVCTFALIPFLRLGQALSVLMLLTTLAGCLALVGPARRLLAPAVLALALGVLGTYHLLAADQPRDALYRRITPYQTLQVVENDGNRYLESDRVVQAGIRLADGMPATSYCQLTPAALLVQPRIERVLMLGLGGGVCATALRLVKPEVAIEYVEIDPIVPQVAAKYLGFKLHPGDRLHIDDARRFLEREDRRWDLIFVDTYIGRAVPFHLATTEFFALVRSRLSPDGVLGINLAGGLQYPFSRAMVRTLSDTFPRFYAFQAPRRTNVVVFATEAEQAPLSPPEIAARAARLDAGHSPVLALRTIAGELGVSLEADLLAAPLLTDSFAPVERLVNLSPTEMPDLPTVSAGQAERAPSP